MKPTGYELSRAFWDFAFMNPDKVKPTHISIYFFSIEHCNRLGWKDKFGLPTAMVLDAIGIKSYSLYKKAFDELVDWGFFIVIQYSKNQYSSNIIALKENYNADNNALDKALIKHSTKQVESTSESIDSIDKQETIEPLNQKPLVEQNEILPPKKSNVSFEDRLKRFQDRLKIHVPTYGKEMIRAFYDYWTEKSEDAVKMRFEYQKSFEITRRLQTWQRNEKNFNNNNKNGKSTIELNRDVAREAIAKLEGNNSIPRVD